jgi:hypothetical protein
MPNSNIAKIILKWLFKPHLSKFCSCIFKTSGLEMLLGVTRSKHCPYAWIQHLWAWPAEQGTFGYQDSLVRKLSSLNGSHPPDFTCLTCNTIIMEILPWHRWVTRAQLRKSDFFSFRFQASFFKFFSTFLFLIASGSQQIWEQGRECSFKPPAPILA